MLKKIITSTLVCAMMFGLVGCGSDGEKKGSTPTEIKSSRKFTEAPGLIKYFTINDEKICFPETVGEYVTYLEKIGTKVELGDTGKTVAEADDMKEGQVSAMVAYLKVYLSDDSEDWQWFGIRYENKTDSECSVADATVTQITLAYDLYSEHENKDNRNRFKSIVFMLNTGEEMAMDGKTSHSKMDNLIGLPAQDTDGHLTYSDNEGYLYKMDTENKYGILGEVQITYPKKK